MPADDVSDIFSAIQDRKFEEFYNLCIIDIDKNISEESQTPLANAIKGSTWAALKKMFDNLRQDGNYNQKVVDHILLQAICLAIINDRPNIIEGISKLFDRSPISLAIIQNNRVVIDKLMEQNVDINAPDNDGTTPFFFAVVLGNLEIINLLIENNVNVNAVPPDGITALHRAVEMNNPQIVELLIPKMNDIDAVSVEGNLTALHCAVIVGHVENVKRLINANADVNIASKHGTPLMIALLIGKQDIANLLIKNSADINEIDSKGMTPLLMAVMESHTEAVRLLIEEGANVNYATSQSCNHLSMSFKQVLIEKRLDGLIAISHNITALHIAVIKGNEEIIKLLLENQANVNTFISSGISSLDFALYNSDSKVSTLLVEHGANLDLIIKNIQEIQENNMYVLVDWLGSILKNNNLKKDASLLTITAALIILKNQIYIKHDQLEIETDAHDTELAAGRLEQVKKYFEVNNILIQSLLIDVVEKELKEMLAERIKKSADSDVVKRPTVLDGNEIAWDKTDQNQLAFYWLTQYRSNMQFLNDDQQREAMSVVNDMMHYVLYCRNATFKDGKPTPETDVFDFAISVEFANLMQSNENMMSCARGTPRGFRAIFDVFLHIKNPLVESQHDKVIAATSSVIYGVVKQSLEQFKNSSAIQEMCAAMATLGSDNAMDLFLNDGVINEYSRLNGFATSSLQKRNDTMSHAYPTYGEFEKAVINNLQSESNVEVKLTKKDIDYLQLQYVAISNQSIRDRIFGLADTEINKINKENFIKEAPGKVKEALNIMNKGMLRNILGQYLEMLVEITDPDAKDNAINNVIGNIKAYNVNMSESDVTRTILRELKEDYDNEIKKGVGPRPSSH